MKTDNKNIDAGKAAALRSAGWRTERIAAEMGITPEAVEEALRAHAISIHTPARGVTAKLYIFFSISQAFLDILLNIF